MPHGYRRKLFIECESRDCGYSEIWDEFSDEDHASTRRPLDIEPEIDLHKRPMKQHWNSEQV
jgi:hypothetical protein